MILIAIGTANHNVRYSHSQNNLMACGGLPIGETTCEVLIPGGGWRLEPYNLTEERLDHTSWTMNNGSIVLLGGEKSVNTTEIITPGVGTRPGFDLKYPS